MAQVTQENTGREGNTRPLSKSRKFVMTLNNYTKAEFEALELEFTEKCEKWIIGFEGDTKTPHLQMYVKYKNARSFASIKKLNDRMHIEKAKGNDKHNFLYCSKELKYKSNYDCLSVREKAAKLCLEQEYNEVKWRPFQDKIITLLGQKPHLRKIHWFWEKEGNMGKSYLAKYIGLTQRIIVATGKKNDIFNQVNIALETYIPHIVLVDIPKAEYCSVNYGALEQLKNGFIYAGKYEGGQCKFPIPHVIVFANYEPEYGQLSEDRWDVVEIT